MKIFRAVMVFLAILAVLAIQNANILNSGIPSDYPEAIRLGCGALMNLQNPYSEAWNCVSGNPNSLGAGYLFLLCLSGVWIVPGVAPLLGLAVCWRLRPDPTVFAVLSLLSFRATLQGMDYLLAGGLACWLMSRSV